jgi:hypothetical protein
MPVSVAYVDDVTFILRSPQEVVILQEALQAYMKASGAVINLRKSRALALGSWSEDTPLLGVAYHPTLRILGVTFANTVALSADDSWRTVTGAIRQQAVL